MTVSICIPYHDTPQTAFYLSRLLKSIHDQNYLDFEIVLTKGDHMARNHNLAILRARGDIIQMMQMDDYFSHPDALSLIVKGFDKKETAWQITACVHDYDGKIGNPHTPHWTDDIWTGNNRLGSITTLSMRKKDALLFEEPLQWLVDCDLYYRLYLKYGYPHLNLDFGLVITERPDRLTNTISFVDKQNEISYLRRKYGKT